MAHTHTIIDHDDHFVIDPVTRKIHPETPAKNKLVRQDHNCERYTFEIPRYIEGHDMSQCDSVRIHYQNISSNTTERSIGVYEVDDLGLLENDSEKAAFTWLISRNATMYAGALNFAIEFKCGTNDAVTYVWHTEIYFSISISESIVNDQAIVEECADVLTGWKNDLFGIGDTVEQQVIDAGNNQINNITARGIEILDSFPEDFTTLEWLITNGYTTVPVDMDVYHDACLWVTYPINNGGLYRASESFGPADTSKVTSAIIRVNPGDKYFIRSSKKFFDDAHFRENVQCRVVGVDEGMEAGHPFAQGRVMVYQPIHDYTEDSLANSDDSYVIEIKEEGIKNLLINAAFDTPFDIIKLLRDNTVIDLTDSKYDRNTWYPVTGTMIPKGGLHKIHVLTTFDMGAHPSWATNEAGYTCNMEVYDKAQTWGQTDGATIATDYSWKHTSLRPCGYLQMTHTSTPVVLLRGGGIFSIETDYASEWEIHTTVYTHEGDTVRPGSASKFLFDRATIFANIDGNVTGDVSNGTVSFTENNSYEIATDEKTSTLFGKMKKFINTIKNKAPYFMTEGRVKSADRLHLPCNIDGFYFDGTSSISRYAECNTSGDLVRKDITLDDNFAALNYSMIVVRFKRANTAENPELLITNKGYAPIYYHGAPVPANYISENSILALIYISGVWEIIGL